MSLNFDPHSIQIEAKTGVVTIEVGGQKITSQLNSLTYNYDLNETRTWTKGKELNNLDIIAIQQKVAEVFLHVIGPQGQVEQKDDQKIVDLTTWSTMNVTPLQAQNKSRVVFTYPNSTSKEHEFNHHPHTQQDRVDNLARRLSSPGSPAHGAAGVPVQRPLPSVQARSELEEVEPLERRPPPLDLGDEHESKDGAAASPVEDVPPPRPDDSPSRAAHPNPQPFVGHAPPPPSDEPVPPTPKNVAMPPPPLEDGSLPPEQIPASPSEAAPMPPPFSQPAAGPAQPVSQPAAKHAPQHMVPPPLPDELAKPAASQPVPPRKPGNLRRLANWLASLGSSSSPSKEASQVAKKEPPPPSAEALELKAEYDGMKKVRLKKEKEVLREIDDLIAKFQGNDSRSGTLQKLKEIRDPLEFRINQSEHMNEEQIREARKDYEMEPRSEILQNIKKLAKEERAADYRKNWSAPAEVPHVEQFDGIHRTFTNLVADLKKEHDLFTDYVAELAGKRKKPKAKKEPAPAKAPIVAQAKPKDIPDQPVRNPLFRQSSGSDISPSMLQPPQSIATPAQPAPAQPPVQAPPLTPPVGGFWTPPTSPPSLLLRTPQPAITPQPLPVVQEQVSNMAMELIFKVEELESSPPPPPVSDNHAVTPKPLPDASNTNQVSKSSFARLKAAIWGAPKAAPKPKPQPTPAKLEAAPSKPGPMEALNRIRAAQQPQPPSQLQSAEDNLRKASRQTSNLEGDLFSAPESLQIKDMKSFEERRNQLRNAQKPVPLDKRLELINQQKTLMEGHLAFLDGVAKQGASKPQGFVAKRMDQTPNQMRITQKVLKAYEEEIVAINECIKLSGKQSEPPAQPPIAPKGEPSVAKPSESPKNISSPKFDTDPQLIDLKEQLRKMRQQYDQPFFGQKGSEDQQKEEMGKISTNIQKLEQQIQARENELRDKRAPAAASPGREPKLQATQPSQAEVKMAKASVLEDDEDQRMLRATTLESPPSPPPNIEEARKTMEDASKTYDAAKVAREKLEPKNKYTQKVRLMGLLEGINIQKQGLKLEVPLLIQRYDMLVPYRKNLAQYSRELKITEKKEAAAKSIEKIISALDKEIEALVTLMKAEAELKEAQKRQAEKV